MIQDPSAPRYTNPRAAPKYHLRRAVLHITNPHGWRDTSVSGQSLLSQWRTDRRRRSTWTGALTPRLKPPHGPSCPGAFPLRM